METRIKIDCQEDKIYTRHDFCPPQKGQSPDLLSTLGMPLGAISEQQVAFPGYTQIKALHYHAFIIGCSFGWKLAFYCFKCQYPAQWEPAGMGWAEGNAGRSMGPHAGSRRRFIFQPVISVNKKVWMLKKNHVCLKLLIIYWYLFQRQFQQNGWSKKNTRMLQSTINTPEYSTRVHNHGRVRDARQHPLRELNHPKCQSKSRVERKQTFLF